MRGRGFRPPHLRVFRRSARRATAGGALPYGVEASQVFVDLLNSLLTPRALIWLVVRGAHAQVLTQWEI